MAQACQFLDIIVLVFQSMVLKEKDSIINWLQEQSIAEGYNIDDDIEFF